MFGGFPSPPKRSPTHPNAAGPASEGLLSSPGEGGGGQVSLASCPPRTGRNDGGAGSRDGFQGRIFILFLLALSLMRNRLGYFKISPYLNLLLPFSSPLA